MHAIARTLVAAIALSALAACGATSTRHVLSPPRTTVEEAAAEYLAMAGPANIALDKLSTALTDSGSSIRAVAGACEALAEADHTFLVAMQTHAWPAELAQLANKMEGAIGAQRDSAHRCYLDSPNQSAMVKDIDALTVPKSHDIDSEWRHALGLPGSQESSGTAAA